MADELAGRSGVGAGERSWMTWTLIGVASIWLGVAGVSMAAPDLVSGSQQEHLPLAAFVSWIWGLTATVGFLWGMSKLRGSESRRSLWIVLVAGVVAIWGLAIVLSALMPVMETGSDPTRVPIWAIVAPLAAALLTLLASVILAMFSDSP